MKKVQLDLPNDVYEEIKNAAAERYQSIRGYITYTLITHIKDQHAGPWQGRVQQAYDWATAPEGVTDVEVKTVQKMKKPPTKEEIFEQKKERFEKLAQEVLGDSKFKRLDLSECGMLLGNEFYDYAEPADDGLYYRWAWTMPENKQREYLNEWSKYFDENP